MKTPNQALPAELQADLVNFAAELRNKYADLFTADPHVKSRCGQVLRSLLPPQAAPGRPGLPSVTKALRLLKTYRERSAGEKPAEIWARIYPKVIPGYAGMSTSERAYHHGLLRDRVRSRRNQQRKRRKNSAAVHPDQTIPATVLPSSL